ncbi:MAG: hypothetical protein M3376_04010, partial [Actinomycetota bacterium]|nr:hypothetical protein [Actinomycetota bacterium]
MRRRTIITTALAAATTLAVAPVSGAPAKRTKVTKLTCTIEAYQQGVPNPTAIHFGFVSCPKPLGSGLHYNEVTVTSKPAPGTPGAANGIFKNYYNRGTTSGTFELTIVASSPTNL